MARGVVLLMLLAVAWGCNWPAMKIVLSEAPVASFRALCLVIAGPVFLALARANGERIALDRRLLPQLMLVSFFNITLWNLCSGFGVSLMPAGRAAILAFTMPVWAMVFAWLVLGEQPTRRRLVGLALGVGALAALMIPEAARLAAAPAGALLMLGGAVGWAIGTVLLKRSRFGMSVMQLTGWQVIVGGIPIVIGAPLFERSSELLDIGSTALVLSFYVLVVGVILGQWTWFKLVEILPAMVAALGSLAVPVVGVLSSALFLGEPVHATDALALVLVLGALTLVVLPQPR